mgnify:CR=1 FL=1
MHFALKFLETILQSTQFFSVIAPAPVPPKPSAVKINPTHDPKPGTYLINKVKTTTYTVDYTVD